MTYRELIESLYDALGQPTNFCPYTDMSDINTFSLETPGAIRCGRLVNRAYKRILSWKFSDGTILRFRGGYDRLYITVTPITATDAVSTDRVIVFPQIGVGDFSGRFDKWLLITAAGERLIVLSSVLAAGNYTLVVHKAPSTVLASESVTLTKNFIKFIQAPTNGYYDNANIACSRINSVVKLRNLSTNTDLSHPDVTDRFSSLVDASGVASQFYVAFNSIVLDKAPVIQTLYEALYKGTPADMAVATDEPSCSAPYHDAILLSALWSGRSIMQDFDAAYATRKDLETLMAQIAPEGSVETENEILGLGVYE